MILAKEAKKLYRETFGHDTTKIFYSHGRLEILGNHTDHQGGVCLVGGVDLGITAAVHPNGDDAIRVASEGYSPFMFYLDELAPKKNEHETTIALFKGVIRKLKDLGYKVGGFSCALKSDLPGGSGLSSSAAVEALVCEIINVLYNKGRIDKMTLAKVSQYAEVVYFGKPCGLLDQIGVFYGGLHYLDFADKENVKIEELPLSLPLKIVLVNTGGSHANLTPHYASIVNDMRDVANVLLGVDRLCDSDVDTFMRTIACPTHGVSERAKLRAQHFFDECKRVEEAKKAIKEKNDIAFINCVRNSQYSSNALLANTFVPGGDFQHSPQCAVEIATRIIGNGAARIMGGGFAGSIICFVYPEDAEEFVRNMGKYYGEENVRLVELLPGGPRLVD